MRAGLLIGTAAALVVAGALLAASCRTRGAVQHEQKAQALDVQAAQHHAVADTHQAQADQAARRVEEIRARTRTDMEPLEIVQVQAEEIAALDVEVKELRLSTAALRQEVQARLEAEEQLRAALRDVRGASVVRRRLVVGGVVVGVSAAALVAWRRR